MKKIAMIPARYAATRFPAKLMQDLAGMTVIRRTYENTLATHLFDQVYVVTDSDIIYREITGHGGKAIMSKKEHECGSDRVAEAVEDMEVDIVVNVQGDEPFTETESLRQLLDVFENDPKHEVDLASLMNEITDQASIKDPNFVKVIVDSQSFALYFSRSPIPYPREQNVGARYFEHRGVYAFRKEALMDFYQLPVRPLEASEKIECIRYLEYGKRIKMIEVEMRAIEIDTPKDLERARKMLK